MDQEFQPDAGFELPGEPEFQIRYGSVSITRSEPGAPLLPRKERDGLPSLEGLRILMAEDNDVNQLVTSVFLSNWDIETEIVSNGRQVIDRLVKSHFDLVIMDINLPGMDGYQTTREIRRHSRPDIKHLPIIGVSGAVSNDERFLAQDSGMNDFICKPINPNELYRKIIQYTLEN
ncbi:MAG: response regulator [Salibacteraceae bacterium]